MAIKPLSARTRPSGVAGTVWPPSAAPGMRASGVKPIKGTRDPPGMVKSDNRKSDSSEPDDDKPEPFNRGNDEYWHTNEED